jgi:hypothetical protein
VNTTAIPVSGLQSPSRSCLTARSGHFVLLLMPRVMLLAVFTALVGLVVATGHLAPWGSLQFLASPQEQVRPVFSNCGTRPISMLSWLSRPGVRLDSENSEANTNPGAS